MTQLPVDTLFYDCQGCRLRHYLFEPDSSVEVRGYIKAINWQKYTLCCVGCGQTLQQKKMYPVRYAGSSIVGDKVDSKVIRGKGQSLDRIIKIKGPPILLNSRMDTETEGVLEGCCALCSVRLEGATGEGDEWQALRIGRRLIVVCGQCERASGAIRWNGVGMLGRLPPTYP